MSVGFCKLCNENKDLQKSHAIGAAIFRKILRADDGKAVEVANNDKYISYSSDSWAEYQLCNYCEGYLNPSYEQYSLLLLRGKKGEFSKTNHEVSFSHIDQFILNHYLLSILWRSANSNHNAYSQITLSKIENERLRLALLNKKTVPHKELSILCSRLTDNTEENGFSDKQLKEIIISPFSKKETINNKIKSTFTFIFEGFMLKYITPGLTYRERQTSGIINKEEKKLLIPYIDVFAIPELVDIMIHAYKNNHENRSNIKN